MAKAPPRPHTIEIEGRGRPPRLLASCPEHGPTPERAGTEARRGPPWRGARVAYLRPGLDPAASSTGLVCAAPPARVCFVRRFSRSSSGFAARRCSCRHPLDIELDTHSHRLCRVTLTALTMHRTSRIGSILDAIDAARAAAPHVARRRHRSLGHSTLTRCHRSAGWSKRALQHTIPLAPQRGSHDFTRHVNPAQTRPIHV
jgi:hypothetical protein